MAQWHCTVAPFILPSTHAERLGSPNFCLLRRQWFKTQGQLHAARCTSMILAECTPAAARKAGSARGPARSGHSSASIIAIVFWGPMLVPGPPQGACGACTIESAHRLTAQSGAGTHLAPRLLASYIQEWFRHAAGLRNVACPGR